MKKVTSPDNGVDTGDGDPTDTIRGIVNKISRAQGGTELENTPDKDSIRKQKENGGIAEPLYGRAPGSDDGPYTPGEYEKRNFSAEDNSSTDGANEQPYGDDRKGSNDRDWAYDNDGPSSYGDFIV